MEGHRLAGSQGVQQVQGLIEPGGAHPGVAGLAERRELGGHRPEPGTDERDDPFMSGITDAFPEKERGKALGINQVAASRPRGRTLT